MTSNVAAYPLHWPDGVKRTKHRRNSPFGAVEIPKAMRDLEDQIRLVPSVVYSTIVVSTNLTFSSRGQPSDVGVAIYFSRRKEVDAGHIDVPYQMACDCWEKVQHNMRALTKHIEAIRGTERWGVGTLEQTFSAYSALPPPRESRTVVSRPWHEVLGVYPTMPIEAVEAVYRTLAKKAHPDSGGTLEAMAELNNAIADARAALG